MGPDGFTYHNFFEQLNLVFWDVLWKKLPIEMYKNKNKL